MARSRSRRRPLPEGRFTATITGLGHDGRGVARMDGKTVFIDGALQGETVEFRYKAIHPSFDEAVATAILDPSPLRIEPRCAHFDVCGGCSLQYLAPERQIEIKQQVLLDNLAHLGKVAPGALLPPLTGPVWGYRRKARLGVKYVMKRRELFVGFRERSSPLLAQLEHCLVLHPSVGERVGELARLIGGLEAYDDIAQIEVAVDDTKTALVLRNMVELGESDRARLIAYAKETGIHLLLQPGRPDTVVPLWPAETPLVYSLPAHQVDFRFEPTDFTQVNPDINRAMVDRALGLLDAEAGDRVLDLFCGLGNFTLPIARRVREVVGVEGDAGLVARARDNALRNRLDNAEFHAADLAAPLDGAPWWRGGFDKVLLDPPRSGAQETLAHVARLKPRRLVYVSCNPATLARDAGILVHQFGYRLEQAGVMDMFPHTAHVESIALFTR
jgi:23S rRNA (uracil1939-C5)-methyltransferase